MTSKTLKENKTIKHEIRHVYSAELQRTVDVDVLMPIKFDKKLPFLILNDGQDSEAVKVEDIFSELLSNELVHPFIIVSVYAGDRIQEYGVSGKHDYAKRGSKAKLYQSFIIKQLIPYLEHQFSVDIHHPLNCIAGYSLGGLSAFDIAWNNDDIFKKTGVFSGSFWWRKRALDKGYTDADRIMHTRIRKSSKKPKLTFWLQAGTHDETSDRNNNGIIDSIDDTLDIISELIKKDYKPYKDVVYYEMEGGEHNQKTWSKAMPVFLMWAFGK